MDDYKLNKNKVVLHKVLIIGAGSVTSETFLEGLSVEMIQNFSKKGLQSEFMFLGKIPEGSKINLNKVLKPGYDGYIIFTPTNEAVFNANKLKTTYSVPVGRSGRIDGNQHVSQFKQGFSVQLYKFTDNIALRWQSELNVDLDAGAQENYWGISNLIFKRLAENQIVFQ